MKREYLLPCVILLLVAIAALIAYLHGTNIPILEPAGPIALQERAVMIITLLLCSIVVVPVFVILFVFAWMFRADRPEARHRHLPDWDHHSGAIEAMWWLVPAIIIVFLSILAWNTSHALDPYKPLQGSGQTITVEVVALDWKWLFIYPQFNIASVNMLEFPENSPIHFELTADAPMNSFWIPQLGGQIMVMPGMQTQLNLLASRTGMFNGFSGNISGEGFSGMAFMAKSVPEADFENWVNAVRVSQHPLTSASYAALAEPSEYNPATYYSPVDGGLYTSIMEKFMLPPQMVGSLPALAPGASAATSSAPAGGAQETDNTNMNMPMEGAPTQ
jgi:cytochrome o ubiquinol oxidase subunit 2